MRFPITLGLIIVVSLVNYIILVINNILEDLESRLKY